MPHTHIHTHTYIHTYIHTCTLIRHFRYLQDAFKVKLVVQMTDDEKFLFKDLTFEDTER